MLAWLEERLPIRQAECKVWPFSKTAAGYGQVWDGVAGTMVNTHVLACIERWGPAPAPGMEVAHGPCHDRACFNGDHVSWKFPADNARDKVRDGTLLFGETHPLAKLSDALVIELRERYATGRWSTRDLAQEVGISREATGRAIRGASWAHLPLPGSLRDERPLKE
jgi:hypothetical protein